MFSSSWLDFYHGAAKRFSLNLIIQGPEEHWFKDYKDKQLDEIKLFNAHNLKWDTYLGEFYSSDKVIPRYFWMTACNNSFILSVSSSRFKHNTQVDGENLGKTED